MLFEFSPNHQVVQEVLSLDTRQIPLTLKRNSRARRYILRVNQQGHACVTIPRRGSVAEARRFAERNRNWLERQFQRLANIPIRPVAWQLGMELLFRGEWVRLEPGLSGLPGVVRLGTETIPVRDSGADVRGEVERHLRRLAEQELPPCVLAFAAAHQLNVTRVSVRNQKSRWGSCSRRGTISPNWRLVQAPPFVRDYIILHELMHLRQMNHSARFWSEVQRVCPEYEIAERWLKRNASLLR